MALVSDYFPRVTYSAEKYQRSLFKPTELREKAVKRPVGRPRRRRLVEEESSVQSRTGTSKESDLRTSTASEQQPPNGEQQPPNDEQHPLNSKSIRCQYTIKQKDGIGQHARIQARTLTHPVTMSKLLLYLHWWLIHMQLFVKVVHDVVSINYYPAACRRRQG